MNDTHFAIGCIWLAAAIGAVVHWHGDRRGLVLFKRAANVTMTAVLVSLSAIAWNHPLPRPSIIQAQASGIEHRPSNIDDQSFRGPFVGATLSHVLHTLDCHYVRRLKHARDGFQSVDEGYRAGFTPCQDCLIAPSRIQQPPSQQAKDKPDLEGNERAAE